MAKGIFTTFEESEILAIRDTAKKLLMEGKTTMSYSVDGMSASKQFAMPVADVLDECRFALRRLDPKKYGSPSPFRRARVARIDK